MTVKTILCLANSRKLSGRCIAGREIMPDADDGLQYGSWIRPISARVTAEISEEERRYENGSDPHVLDIIEVPMLVADPHLHQTENWVIDDKRHWHKKGEASWEGVCALLEKPDSLWTVGDSTQYGMNDRVSLEKATEMTRSLVLIKPEYLQVHVGVSGPFKRRVKASFLYNGTQYLLVVTDPVVERAFLPKANGAYALEEVFLCVSLTENWEGSCYKLVASITGRPI
jgi:hypothetical protein